MDLSYKMKWTNHIQAAFCFIIVKSCVLPKISSWVQFEYMYKYGELRTLRRFALTLLMNSLTQSFTSIYIRILSKGLWLQESHSAGVSYKQNKSIY